MMMMEKDNLDDFIRAKKRLRVHLYYIHFWCKQGKIELHRSFFLLLFIINRCIMHQICKNIGSRIVYQVK